MTLTSGVLNLAFGVTNLLPLTPREHIAQVCVGVVGILLAWRPAHARIFGIALLLGFGALFLIQTKAAAGWFGGWWPLRMTCTGAAITFIPANGTWPSKR